MQNTLSALRIPFQTHISVDKHQVSRLQWKFSSFLHSVNLSSSSSICQQEAKDKICHFCLPHTSQLSDDASQASQSKFHVSCLAGHDSHWEAIQTPSCQCTANKLSPDVHCCSSWTFKSTEARMPTTNTQRLIPHHDMNCSCLLLLRGHT